MLTVNKVRDTVNLHFKPHLLPRSASGVGHHLGYLNSVRLNETNGQVRQLTYGNNSVPVLSWRVDSFTEEA